MFKSRHAIPALREVLLTAGGRLNGAGEHCDLRRVDGRDLHSIQQGLRLLFGQGHAQHCPLRQALHELIATGDEPQRVVD